MSAPILTHASGAGEDTDDPTGYIPPQQVIAAEQSVLGGMLLSTDALAEVRSHLAPEDFFRPAHQELARRIGELAEQNDPVDPVTLVNAFEPRELDRIGGAAYVHTLTATVPTAANAGYYADIVRTHAHRRAAIRTGRRIEQIAASADPDEGPAALAERVRTAVADYETEVSSASSAPHPVAADLDAWLDDKLHGPDPVVYRTGLADLDRITGVRPGEMLVIAARPSIGKTLMGLRLAIQTARSGAPVVLFSLEMTRAEVLDRVVAAVCRIEHEHLRNKQLTSEDQQRIATHREELRQLPLYVEDASELTMPEIRALAREYQRHQGVQQVVIDYLGLLRPEKATQAANRERQVSEMSTGARTMAKQLQLPVVLIVQINRGPEQRADRTPQLADLRESGAIEADAHQVWLLHRPEFFAAEETRMNPENHPGEVQVNVAKNRGGRVGSVWLAFRPHHQDIADLA